ncbi:MAG: CBS domain-containing protein [Pseudomonadota bacterium]
MKVSVILENKPSDDIATITPEHPVRDAVGALSSRRIGALVVSRSGSDIQGIVSERDIIRRMGKNGVSVLERPVSEIMTAPVETCFLSETALEILSRMTEGRFRHMPVTNSAGQMTGILSIGDVVKARLEEIEAENAAMADMLSS